MRNALVFLLIPALACSGGGGGSTGPVSTGSGGQGTFTAVIDGANWASTTNQTTTSTGASAVPGTIVITGTQLVSATNYTTLTINLGYLSGPGTYPLGVNPGTTAGGTGQVIGPQSGSAIGDWSTNLTGSAGSLTVTSLTSTRITGTFQFTAPPQSFTQTTGTRVVTNGAFDMPLPSGFSVAPADNDGSKVSATIGGKAWNGATVVSLGTAGVFGFTASTDSLSVSFTPATTMSAGSTYPIGGSGGASMIVTATGTSSSWSSAGASAVGSFSVTSDSGTRATGTFSATLSGTGGTLVIAGGTFDVRVDSP